jgi:MFS family permease
LTYIPSLFVMLGAVIFRSLSSRSNAVQLSAFLAVLGVGLAGIGIAESIPQMIAAVIVQQTGVGMAVPTLIAWAQTKFPFEHRGRGIGAWTSAFFLGQFASPWLVGRFAHVFGSMHGAFLMAGVVAIALGIVVTVSFRSGGGVAASA